MGLSEEEATKKEAERARRGKLSKNKEFLLSHTFHLTPEPADLFSLVRLRDSIPTLLAVGTNQL